MTKNAFLYMTNIPVKGAVLVWARKFRGLSEAEAADKLGMTVDELDDYEKERKVPTLTLFEDFANKYRLPQATLFLDSQPDVPPDPADFRSIRGRRQTKHSFDFKVALSEVRNLLFYIGRVIKDDEDFVPPKLPQLTLDDDPALAGERERRRVGIGVEEQLGWPSDKAFTNWRTYLEKQGIFVFQSKFPIEDGRGFSLYDSADSPTIIVNREENTKNPKAFTIFHEYAHLLLRKPGVSDERFSNPTESFCNRFSAAFLIPTEALRKLLPVWPNRPIDWERGDIERWARRLKVSQRSLAIRLEQLQLAPERFGDKFVWHAKPRPKRDGGDQVATRLSDIGFNFTDKVLSAWDRGAIDEVQAVQAIGISTDYIGRAREYVDKRRVQR